MSAEETEQLMKMITAMGVKPKCDTPQDLLKWMSDMVGKEEHVPESFSVKKEPFTPTSKQTMEYPVTFKQPLRISTFSGGGKGETSYELWRYKVTCLLKEGHSKESILMAIRRLLKGESANVLMRLGTIIKVDDIIVKFDSIYGSVLETENILAEFYSAAVAIPKVETEHVPVAKPKQAIVKAATSDERFDQLQAQLNQLSTQMAQMRQPYPQYHQPRFRPPFQRGRKNPRGYMSQARMPFTQRVEMDEVQPTSSPSPRRQQEFSSIISDQPSQLQQAKSWGQGFGHAKYRSNTKELVGEANEVTVAINDVTCAALLDTGATVSTITTNFYQRHLSHIKMHPVEDILHIECADGEQMPYFGYVCVTLTAYGTPLDLLENCLFLIVPDSTYNSRVPVLIGTNIINRLMENAREEFISRYLQDADLHTFWYLSFRCMNLRSKELQRNGNKLSIIKSAEP
ncbi:uncharacterized protein LOC134262945 [Saccostrea cucullata]|uniref:uncharacterized protein LOC134262945 n=1 Tax=Saccostrea cuccullata TaxID=36930 RepID=UPI002ED1C1A3